MERTLHPIDNYEIPSLLARIAAATLDLAIFIFVALILFSIGGFVVSQEGQTYANYVALVDDHIHYAQLANKDDTNQYVALSDNDLLSMQEDNALIINRLSYFYLSYLTGENIGTNLEPSLHYQESVVVDGVSIAKKDYYAVEFFNNEILKIGEENSYFVYQKTGGNVDTSKVGVVDDFYIETVDSDSGPVLRIKRDVNLLLYLKDIYEDAIVLFYNQPSIIEANNYVNLVNSILMLGAGVLSFSIFYLLLPLLSKNYRTIGKHIFKLTVVDNDGYKAKKWRIALRSFPLFGAIVYVAIINSIYFQFLLPLLLLMLSVGILVFNTKRKALHDWMAGTIVISTKQPIKIYDNVEQYEEVLKAIKERSQTANGK